MGIKHPDIMGVVKTGGYKAAIIGGMAEGAKTFEGRVDDGDII